MIQSVKYCLTNRYAWDNVAQSGQTNTTGYKENFSTTPHLYYIAGGDGLSGIYVKQTKGSATLIDSMYYVHTDHLGSLAIITGANGNIVQHTTYDAWGVRTFLAKNNSPPEFVRNLIEIQM